MKVSIVGTGYVGLVSGACLAQMGHSVCCIDRVPEKINQLQNGQSPIYEAGLEELLEHNLGGGRLKFALDYESCRDAQVIFLVVATPSGEGGQANLDFLKSAAATVAPYLSDGALVVIKSTVPLGTSSLIKQLIASKTDKRFFLVNNPEFLREGRAVEDFMSPDRIIVGFEETSACEMMGELYAPWIKRGYKVYYMDYFSAEMAKYASNCFLACKISFVNEIARLCDLVGADIEQVCRGMASDPRIGEHFLRPGPGYGGSCFPKDVGALLHTARECGTELHMAQAAQKANRAQKLYIFEKIKSFFHGHLKGKTLAFWGVAFKANTDDIRESAAIDLAVALIEGGVQIKIYDPVASDNFLKAKALASHLKSIQKCGSMYSCLKGCDGLVIMTEWEEFKNPDFSTLKKDLANPAIFDARNLLVTTEVLQAGLKYLAVGRKIS